jgi:hypothetical protein
MTTKQSGARLGDLLANVDLSKHSPAVAASPISAAEAEGRLRGMVRTAHPQLSADKLEEETRKVLQEYSNAGTALARLLRGLLVGEIQQRRKESDLSTNWLHFVNYVQVKRLTMPERNAAWQEMGARRPRGKRGEPSDDLFILAAYRAEPTSVISPAALRRRVKRCHDEFGWAEDDVPASSMADEFGLPPVPPVNKQPPRSAD